MTYKVTMKLFFKNGSVKRVDMLKDAPIDKETGEPLGADVLEDSLGSLLQNCIKANEVISFRNIRGKTNVVDCGELYFVDIEVTGDVEEPDTDE